VGINDYNHLDNDQETFEVTHQSSAINKELDEAIMWTKQNPLKATLIGATGLLALKSKLVRQMVMMGVTSFGTLMFRKSMMNSELMQ
tara:strand:+ start:5559 stop:5819 length:261 start_codon:yes stop_codon:yes gene_type:complete